MLADDCARTVNALSMLRSRTYAVLHAMYCVSKRTPTTHSRRRRIFRMRHRAVTKASNEGSKLGNFTRVRDFTATRITRLRTERTLRKWNTLTLTAREFRVARVIDRSRSIKLTLIRSIMWNIHRHLLAIRDDRREIYNDRELRLNHGYSVTYVHVRTYDDGRIGKHRGKRFLCVEDAIRLHRQDGIILRRSEEKLRCNREKFTAPYN